MAVNRIAVIEIGALDMIMKVYELSAKKGINLIDTLHQMVPVGRDSYRDGKISSQVLEKICSVLQKFRRVLQEYRITECHILATGAIREAQNCAMVVDQIRVRTGFQVRVLSNSEQRYVRIKGVIAGENHSRQLEKGTALVDIGSGSLQVSICEKKNITSTQNISLGIARISEMFSMLSWEYPVVEHVLQELIDNDIQTFGKLILKEHTIRSLVLLGDGLMPILRRCLEQFGDPGISKEDIKGLYQRIKGRSAAEIGTMLEIPLEYAAMMLPVLILTQALLEASGAESVWIPQSDLCDGFAVDCMENRKLGKAGYDFEEDILASARLICKRYKGNQVHAQAAEQMACRIFDALRAFHGLGAREKLLLRLAALLHDCGKFISMSNPGDCSYQIIMSTEILGLSHAEREMVACIARYNTKGLPAYEEFDGRLDNTEYLVVMKLAAILRVCNALDRSHKQKFQDMKIVIRGSVMQIITACQEDITLERMTLADKQTFFEAVYGLTPEIKQKRKNRV